MNVKMKPLAEPPRAVDEVIRVATRAAFLPAWQRGLPPCEDKCCQRELGHEGRHMRPRVEFDEW